VKYENVYQYCHFKVYQERPLLKLLVGTVHTPQGQTRIAKNLSAHIGLLARLGGKGKLFPPCCSESSKRLVSFAAVGMRTTEHSSDALKITFSPTLFRRVLSRFSASLSRHYSCLRAADCCEPGCFWSNFFAAAQAFAQTQAWNQLTLATSCVRKHRDFVTRTMTLSASHNRHHVRSNSQSVVGSSAGKTRCPSPSHGNVTVGRPYQLPVSRSFS